MSRTSEFKFTNKTASTKLITPVVISSADYAKSQDDANVVVYNNKTAPIDSEEIISVKSRLIPSVSTSLNIQNPAPVKKGLQFAVIVENTLTTTDSADATFRVDEPICWSLTCRFPRSGNVTAALIAQSFERAISACRRSDGTYLFDDFMRQAEGIAD